MSRNLTRYRPCTPQDRTVLALRARLRTLQATWQDPIPPRVASEPFSNPLPRTAHRMRMLWERNNGRCHYCCRPLTDTPYHIDHIIPKAHSGPNHLDNLTLACRLCNIRKKHKSALMFSLQLLSLHY